MSAWHKWCSETIDRELSEELRTLAIWCAIMISAFLIAATVGTVFFVRWFKLSEAMRASMRPTVRFTALMTLGCIFGALSFAFYYLSLSNFYEMEQWPRNPQFFTNAQLVHMTEHVAFHDYWWSGIVTSRAFEQLFTTFANLLILEHMFPATLLLDPLLKVRIRRLSVALAVLFVMLNLANIGAMIACSVYNGFAGREFLRSAAAYRRGDNSTGAELLFGANQYNDRANNVQGVGSSIEAVIVVSIVVVFAAVGLYIWRVLRRASLLLQSISIRVKGNYNVAVAKSAIKEGSAMQKRVEGTVAVVFVLFVIRAVYASMFAASFALYDLNPACSECAPCQTTLTVMGVWFISNPALLLAMFGMFLSEQDLQTLRGGNPNKSERISLTTIATEPSALS